jgi:uncharacterized membrane protein
MPMSKEDTTIKLEPNIAGLLCYAPCCIGLLFSLAMVVIEKKSRFVRFHAYQSLLLQAVAIVVFLGLGIAQWVASMIFWPFGLLFTGLAMLLALGFLGLMVMLMMKAYANEEYMLHALGEQASKWV